MIQKLLLVGCGKMGGALLAGWVDRGLDPKQVTVVEPYADSVTVPGVGIVAEAAALEADFAPDVVVFAVKPQMTDGVVPAFARFVGPNTVFLSIAAGRTIGYYAERLGSDAAIVRCMPNTPAAVRRGMTVACANAGVSAEQRGVCANLLEAVGEVDWVEDEALLDAVTAVSGSGPAYVFLLAECLAQAAIEVGLPAELADKLARTTVSGAGELLRLSTESSETLRVNVTSPGGTTAEALAVLMADDGFGPLLKRAVAAAERRSRELAG